MNENKKELLRGLGFHAQIDAVEESKCPFCRKPINVQGFRDDLSHKEFTISGLCQKCQDEMFGAPKDEN